MKLTTGLKRLTTTVLLRREARRLRTDVQALTRAVTRIADLLEADYQERHPRPAAPQQASRGPGIEVSVVTDQMHYDWMQKELDLTRVKGMPPTEEEILQAFERDGAEPPELKGQ